MGLIQYPLRSLMLATVLLLPAIATADAQEENTPSVADVRWQALSSVANLYLADAPVTAFIERGDEEKSQWNNYAGALAYYLMATDRDQTNSWAPYQAAAALAYLQVPKQAHKYLQLADERGFWQYITMQEDNELESISETPEFQRLLANAKQRYQQHATDTGKAYIYIPKGNAPAAGWPVLVWLSGYGTEGSDSADMAQLLAGDKAIFVGINGTEKLGEHRFRWARKDTESTQQAVQQALAKVKQKTQFDAKRVALMGFSQGALHSAHLLAEHADDYCGALIVSAGGRQTELTASAPQGKRIVLSYGEGEHSSNKNLDQKLAGYFGEHNQFEQHIHQGGHFFDKAWQQTFPQYVAKILQF